MRGSRTTRRSRTVVVGAGVSGVRTAMALRRRGFDGEVILLSEENRPPYDRPPLTKQILTGSWRAEQAQLTHPGQLREMSVDLRLGSRVVELGAHGIRLADGEHIGSDFIVLATGSVPHSLADQPRDRRMHLIRSLDDALALRAALSTSASLLIVGGGMIGGEVASAARDIGMDVDLVEAGPAAFVRALGPVGAAVLTARHRDRGVRVHAGRWPETWHTDAAGVHLDLDDGTRLSADRAVVAVGSRPALDWLLDMPECGQPLLQANLEQGLACDSDGRVIGTSSLYAVGDCAAWTDVGTGIRTRGQHWTRALEQAEVVAAVIAARAAGPAHAARAAGPAHAARAAGPASHDHDLDTSFPTVGPAYAWTDQAGIKVQVVGDPHLGEVHTTLSTSPSGAVVITSDRGHVVAVTLIDTPRALAPARIAVTDAVPIDYATELIGAKTPLNPTTVAALAASH